MATAAAPPADVGTFLCAKAGPDGNSLGDCPFTWKANLALRFKENDFKTFYIDLSDKPQWFLDLTESGSTPVFVDGSSAIGDSDEIVEYADEIGPKKDITLIREDDARWNAASDVVSPLLKSFINLLKNKNESDESSLKDALTNALVNLDKFMAETGGPYLLGKGVSAWDCNLAPKLQHIMVAAPHYKNYQVPKDCANIWAYMDHMKGTSPWKGAACTDDVIIWGWSKFF